MTVGNFGIRPPLPRFHKNDFLKIGQVAISQVRIKNSEGGRNIPDGPNPDLINTNQFCIDSTPE
jgi:hypothetical protein